LSHSVAGLPTELDPESEEAKHFDLLALSLQIALLRAEPGFQRLRDRVVDRGKSPFLGNNLVSQGINSFPSYVVAADAF